MNGIKTFFKKMLLFSLPFLLALVFFFAFEPYDYFLLKGECGYLCRALHSIRVMRSGECENILLGNSLTANLNEGYIEEISGEDYDMLAYGGATLNESIEQFWYAAERNDLKKVVIGLNFYTINDGMLSETRFNRIKKEAENPLLFIGNFNYWIEAFHNFRIKIGPSLCSLTGDERFLITDDDPSSLTQDIRPDMTRDTDGVRKNLKRYADQILTQSNPYAGVDSYLSRLLEIADYCDSNGIELTFVIFNCHKTVWEDAVFPIGANAYIDYYSAALASVANVYDFESYNEYCENDEIFIDGFHLVLEEKQRLIRVIFGGETDPYCEVYRKGE